MRVEKVHRVLSFQQSPWMKPYIEKNTNLRKQAASKFEEDFFKLLNNSAYGKTCESKRRRLKVTLARSEEEAYNMTVKPTFKSFTIFGPDLALMTSQPRQIRWDKPTIVGAVVLELSKLHMFKFHYMVMKQSFNCRLLYSDTDSLLYRIQTEDLYADLAAKRDLHDKFDFSNYPRDHTLFNEAHKKVVLKFKDEFAGKPIHEYCALKPKMYSVKCESKLPVYWFPKIRTY